MSTHIPSTGGTILDLHLVDAIAGQIAVGILTAGAENRMGRLIRQLGNRNLLQIKVDPEYRLGEKTSLRNTSAHIPRTSRSRPSPCPWNRNAIARIAR